MALTFSRTPDTISSDGPDIITFKVDGLTTGQDSDSVSWYVGDTYIFGDGGNKSSSLDQPFITEDVGTIIKVVIDRMDSRNVVHTWVVSPDWFIEDTNDAFAWEDEQDAIATSDSQAFPVSTSVKNAKTGYDRLVYSDKNIYSALYAEEDEYMYIGVNNDGIYKAQYPFKDFELVRDLSGEDSVSIRAVINGGIYYVLGGTRLYKDGDLKISVDPGVSIRYVVNKNNTIVTSTGWGGGGRAYIYTSTDNGETFSPSLGPYGNAFYSIIVYNDMFIARYDESNSNSKVFKSTDGITWRLMSLPFGSFDIKSGASTTLLYNLLVVNGTLYIYISDFSNERTLCSNKVAQFDGTDILFLDLVLPENGNAPQHTFFPTKPFFGGAYLNAYGDDGIYFTRDYQVLSVGNEALCRGWPITDINEKGLYYLQDGTIRGHKFSAYGTPTWDPTITYTLINPSGTLLNEVTTSSTTYNYTVSGDEAEFGDWMLKATDSIDTIETTFRVYLSGAVLPPIGKRYFHTELKKPVWWDGSRLVDIYGDGV